MVATWVVAQKSHLDVLGGRFHGVTDPVANRQALPQFLRGVTHTHAPHDRAE